MHRTTALVLLFALAPLGRPAAARDIYVNNVTGNDKLGGAAPTTRGDEGPVKSIGRALTLARLSDRVRVVNTGQPYREPIAVAGPCLRGTERRPLVIESDGAVLDGTVTAASGAWRHVQGDVFALRPRRLTYQQLFSDGQPLQRVRVAAWNPGEGALEPLQWTLTNRAILLRVESSRLPESYPLRHAGLQTGVTLYNTEHVVIDGLVVQGFQQDGVNAHETARDCVLRNVESRANGRAGLSAGGVSRVDATRCRFYDNGRVQVRTEGLARVELENCEVDDKTAAAFSAAGGRLIVDGRDVTTR